MFRLNGVWMDLFHFLFPKTVRSNCWGCIALQCSLITLDCSFHVSFVGLSLRHSKRFGSLASCCLKRNPQFLTRGFNWWSDLSGPGAAGEAFPESLLSHPRLAWVALGGNPMAEEALGRRQGETAEEMDSDIGYTSTSNGGPVWCSNEKPKQLRPQASANWGPLGDVWFGRCSQALGEGLWEFGFQRGEAAWSKGKGLGVGK